jgi:glutathione synthase/RimK-type ligase-like ATP-grasp enzyme
MAKVSVISRHPSHKRLEFPKFDLKVRIRFGSTTDFPARKDIDFPSKEAIRNTASKIRMKKKFDEAEVPSPAWGMFDPTKWREMLRTAQYGGFEHLLDDIDGIVVPRFELIFKESNHSRGEGIMFINTHNDIRSVIENGKKGYVERVIGNDREFRVHVCDGKAFYTDEKLPREEGHTAKIKNLANGYKYRNRSVSRPYPREIRGVAIKAVESLGMEFGAVDIAIDVTGNIHVFEVNSAMGLRTKTAQLYQEKLTELIIKKGANLL